MINKTFPSQSPRPLDTIEAKTEWPSVNLFCIYDLATNTPIAVWDEEAKQWQDILTGEHAPRFDHVNPHEVTEDGS